MVVAGIVVGGPVVAEVVHRSESEDSPVAIAVQRSCVVAEWVAVVVAGTSAARVAVVVAVGTAGIVGIAVDTAVPVVMLARPEMRLRMFLAMDQSP